MEKLRMVDQHTADPVANPKASHGPATGPQLSCGKEVNPDTEQTHSDGSRLPSAERNGQISSSSSSRLVTCLDTPGSIASAFRYDSARSGSHTRELLHRIRDLALVFLGWLAPVAQYARDTQNEAQRIVEESLRYQETDEKLKALAEVMKKEWNETVQRPAA